MSEEEIVREEARRKIRLIAEGVLVDTLITFNAILRSKGLSGEEFGPLALDEWGAACHEMGTLARQQIEQFREAGSEREALLLALGASRDLDEHVDALIEERRALMAESQEDEAEEPNNDGSAV